MAAAVCRSADDCTFAEEVVRCTRDDATGADTDNYRRFDVVRRLLVVHCSVRRRRRAGRVRRQLPGAADEELGLESALDARPFGPAAALPCAGMVQPVPSEGEACGGVEPIGFRL